jgi:hypothetical protein
MAKRKSFLGPPLLITHWDPDMYPSRPLPLIPELVIYILAHGEVWIKDVDLFLNSRIAAVLSDPAGFQQFSSLVATKRVKVLIPDTSRDLEDPVRHGVEFDRDLVAVVEGVPTEAVAKKLGSTVRGGTSLRVKVPFNTLGDMLDKAGTLYDSNAYKKIWPEIDNVTLVKDEALADIVTSWHTRASKKEPTGGP